jgi:hypothetical protein
MKKLLRLLPVLALAGCGSSTPPPSFAPLDYSYLRPITFKVATLDVVNNYTPSPGEAPLIAANPAPPADTLMAMLKTRMQPSGQPGAGTITVQNASITESGGNLNGQMVVDINLTGPNNATGFAEATVSRSVAAPDGDPNSPDMQAALYQMSKDLMTAINVQLPYQIAHNIPSWVSWVNPVGGVSAPSTDAGSAGGIIQSAPLTAPGGATSTGSTPVPLTPSTPSNTNSAVPNYLPGAGPASLGAPQ